MIEVREISHSSKEKSITAHTFANGDKKYSLAYFGSFVLEADQEVASVVSTEDSGSNIELEINKDYIVQRINDLIVCNVRIPINSSKVKLNYR